MPGSNQDQAAVNQTVARERRRLAVASLIEYMRTYAKDPGYLDYSEATYIDDVLYGLGRSLGNEYEYADGFEEFKKVLLKRLGA